MTRADLIASLVPHALAGLCAEPDVDGEEIPALACEIAENTADEMIRRGIVKVDDAEPRTGNA